MDFAEQGLKIRGRKQLIYTFLIKLTHNLFMGKGERERDFELRGCSKACFHFLIPQAQAHQPLGSLGSEGNPISKGNKTQSPEAPGEVKCRPHCWKS